jgi:hypothetical protein
MRTVVLAAALVGALSLARPALAAAQDPAPAPPPPAPRDVAVPRAERAAERRAEAAPAAREGKARHDPEAAPESRREIAPPLTTSPSASAAAAPDAAGEPQRSGGQRGAVRRPPSGGTSRGDSPRGGTVDRAVPRSSVPQTTNRVYVSPNYYHNSYYRYYDPWGFGAFGLGYFYYSPWGWNPGYYGSYGPYGYGPPYAGAGYGVSGYDTGSIKLKVKPRDAEVFVDGYFAGTVDDFDGTFQALKLDSGAYSIEVRKPGFETLRFDVRVQPERSITFRGEMKAAP